MANSIWQKIDEIFPQVADLPAGEREKRLKEFCGTDESLRREIEALLAVEEKAESFIETPVMLPDSLAQAFSAVNSDHPPTLELAGKKIGAYRIERKLGAGGMGAVYLAERADGEFYKKVAIKVVKNGADTEFNLARFRRERQILADLEHPNIARLIDGGTFSEDRSPYLVMEYVEGLTIFDYCKNKKLDLNERLRLFRQICKAVEYAHEKGVIHRDIKPGNILVNDDGKVKLLDFGIAKVFDAEFVHDSANGENTDTFLRQMTPEYASPEQIRGEQITPLSDVYSLGVVLYELVSGERPYKFPSRAPHEIARVICEEKVQSPKLKIDGQKSDDLSFIVLKSLQKKRDERFNSVRDFRDAVERFLNDLPVLTEDSRLEYFENTMLESGGETISLAIAPFQVLPAETDKVSAEFLSIGLADALTTRLSGVRQIAVRPTSSVTRITAAAENAFALGKELAADYVLEGRVLRSENRVRVNLQLLKIRTDSVLWAEQFDEADADVFQLQDSIGERVTAALVPRLTTEEREILRYSGTSEPAAYEAYLRGRVSFHTYTFAGIIASKDFFKKAIERDPNFAAAHSGLADFYNWQAVAGTSDGLVSNGAIFEKAKESARRAIEIEPNLSEAYASLAFATWAYDWDFAEAERLFEKSIKLNPNNVKAHEWFAYLYSSTEKHEEAIYQMRRAEQLDPSSPSVAAMFSFCLFNARLYEEAYAKTHRALELAPDYYLALQGLGWVCPPLGKFDEAIAGCRRAVEISDDMSFNKFSLALALIAAGQIKEARQIAAEIEKNKSQNLNVQAYFLALIYANLEEFDAAFRWLDKAIEERGYWTLWMRVEPRLDVLREDQRFDERFAELLNKIKPLHIAPTTDSFISPPTEKMKPSGRYKTYAAVIAVFTVLIISGFYIWRNPIFVVKKMPPENVSSSTAGQQTGEEPRTNDAVADDLYLAGKKQLELRSPDGIKKAVEFFSEAVVRDPNFALAFAGLADAHILLAGRDKEISPANAYRIAEEYAVKALAIDPDLAEARISLGMAKFKNTKDFAQAEKHFLRAIEIDPSSASAHHWYSVVLSDAGKTSEAFREIETAARLEPDSAIIQYSLGEAYFDAGRYDQAMVHYDKAIEIDNEFIDSYYSKSLVQQFQGDYEAALDTYRKQRIYNGKTGDEPLLLLMQAQAHAVSGRRTESLAVLERFFGGAEYQKNPGNFAAEIALVYHLLGERANAFLWLEKVERAEEIKFLKKDPRFAALRADSRFTALIESKLAKK